MLYEFDTTLRGENVTVHISTFKLQEEEDPFIDFEVFDSEGEELELTDEEVDKFLIDIIDFMEDQAELEQAEHEEQERGW